MLISNPNLPLSLLGNHEFVFYVCGSVSTLFISSFVSYFFKIPHISDITYLSLSYFRKSLDLLMLLQMALFHSFL